MAITTYLLLSVNGLSASTERRWIVLKKQEPSICCLHETHFRYKDTQTKSETWKNLSHANGNQKKAGVPTLPSNKINFKTNTVIRNKDGCYITIKGT